MQTKLNSGYTLNSKTNIISDLVPTFLSVSNLLILLEVFFIEDVNTWILDGLDILFKRYSQTAPFVKIDTGRIVTQDGSTSYIVEVNGQKYSCPTVSGSTYRIGEIVKVIIPDNQFSERFLLPNASSSLSDTDAQLYDKCVAYVDEKVGDIESILATLVVGQ